MNKSAQQQVPPRRMPPHPHQQNQQPMYPLPQYTQRMATHLPLRSTSSSPLQLETPAAYARPPPNINRHPVNINQPQLNPNQQQISINQQQINLTQQPPSIPYRLQQHGYSAEYPPAFAPEQRLASRACMHSTNNQTYSSVPFDTSIQPLLTHMSSLSVAPATETNSYSSGFSSSDPYSSSLISGGTQSTGPQPLTEYVSQSGGSMSTQQTQLHPQRGAPHHRDYHAPILQSDQRYNTYFHLSKLFDEKAVRKVLNKYPKETDVNRITQAVLIEQSAKQSKW